MICCCPCLSFSQNLHHFMSHSQFCVSVQFKIPKEFQKNSERIPKEFPKNSQKFPKKLPRLWKHPIPYIALGGWRPFRACLCRYSKINQVFGIRRTHNLRLNERQKHPTVHFLCPCGMYRWVQILMSPKSRWSHNCLT